MIVVGASALIEVLLNTPAAPRVAARILAPGESLHVPHVVDLEVAQVLRRFVRSKEISTQRGREASEDLSRMPLTRYPHNLLHAPFCMNMDYHGTKEDERWARFWV